MLCQNQTICVEKSPFSAVTFPIKLSWICVVDSEHKKNRWSRIKRSLSHFSRFNCDIWLTKWGKCKRKEALFPAGHLCWEILQGLFNSWDIIECMNVWCTMNSGVSLSKKFQKYQAIWFFLVLCSRPVKASAVSDHRFSKFYHKWNALAKNEPPIKWATIK